MNSAKASSPSAKKVAKNRDPQNRDIALKKILEDVMTDQRRQEIDLYKLYAKICC